MATAAKILAVMVGVLLGRAPVSGATAPSAAMVLSVTGGGECFDKERRIAVQPGEGIPAGRFECHGAAIAVLYIFARRARVVVRQAVLIEPEGNPTPWERIRQFWNRVGEKRYRVLISVLKGEEAHRVLRLPARVVAGNQA